MSVLVQALVYQHSEARLADRLVLLAIADEADDDGGSAFPSLRRIAHKARVSVSTASAAVKRLEDSGELEVERPETTGRGHHNRYRVLVGKGSESEPFDEKRTRERNLSPADEAPESSVNVRPRGSTDPSNAREPYEADFDETWKHYPRKIARKQALRAYQATRRRGTSSEELLRATERYAKLRTGEPQQFTLHGSTFFGPDERWRDFLVAEATAREVAPGSKWDRMAERERAR